MQWQTIIHYILHSGQGWTLDKIAQECGFSSKGALHDLKSGLQKTCSYERGCRLMALHDRIKRRQRRKASA